MIYSMYAEAEPNIKPKLGTRNILYDTFLHHNVRLWPMLS